MGARGAGTGRRDAANAGRIPASLAGSARAGDPLSRSVLSAAGADVAARMVHVDPEHPALDASDEPSDRTACASPQSGQCAAAVGELTGAVARASRSMGQPGGQAWPSAHCHVAPEGMPANSSSSASREPRLRFHCGTWVAFIFLIVPSRGRQSLPGVSVSAEISSAPPQWPAMEATGGSSSSARKRQDVRRATQWTNYDAAIEYCSST